MYAVGTQKNHLNETVLLSTQNRLNLMGKKTFAILSSHFLFNSTYDSKSPDFSWYFP